MKIETLSVGMFETNCYLVYDEQTRAGLIIDPGAEAERIIEAIKRLNMKPEKIILTHGHGDHIGGVEALIAEYKIPLFIGNGDEELLVSAVSNFSAMYGLEITCPAPDGLYSEGDKVTFSGHTLSVIHTPGHSPGGVCYRSDGIVFCGDTLFFGSVGRTDFPGCSHEKLINSINEKLMTLPDETICYPGHGPATTIGQERKINPFLAGGRFV